MRTKTVFLAAPAAVVASIAAQSPALAAPLPPLDAARVQAISEMLPPEPMAVGKPIADRAYWNRLASDKRLASVLPTAEKLQKTPLPEWGAELFLDFSRDGNRTRYQNNESARRGRLAIYTLAECMENKGRFVAPLAALIDSLCQEKTWMLPAHDAKLDNYNGKTIDIDLVSSALAAQLGTIDAIMGDKLPPQTRQNLRTNVQTRVLVPFHDMITGKREPNWWILTENNWNAVCLNGVVGASLTLEPSRSERALVVAAEKYSENFLSGFTPDGYCSEGLGYWNYGFGNYDLLCEAIRQETGGKLDLMARPKSRMPALFGARIQIMNDIAPAFADCPVFALPSVPLMASVNRRFALHLPGYEALSVMPAADVYETLVYVAGETAPPIKAASAQANAPLLRSPLRDYFDKAGILISRPAPGATTKIGVALKGGNNAENHNHNDVGSYVVVVGGRPVLLDPGSETYTARTFSSHRYDSKLLNSFGHPVPKFGDVLQHAGADAKGKLVAIETTPDRDTFALDIASAYTLPALKALTRTWNYSRTGDGYLMVSDSVALSTPTRFGTAFLTLGGYRKNADGTLFVYDGASAVNVKIDTGGKAYTISSTVIEENAPVKPTRIGIDLNDPVTGAIITLTITPVVDAAANGASANLLINGGLERGGFGWSLGAMGTVSENRAKTGTASLRILDDASDAGSSVESARAAIPTGATRLALKGVANFASGGGVGLYLHFYDKDNKSLAVVDAAGNEAATGVLEGGAGAVNQWKPFLFSASVPPGATKAQLWIHTFNAAKCDVYLDDLSLVVEK